MAATIIGALIAVGGTALSAYLGNQETDKAKREARTLSQQERGDTLREKALARQDNLAANAESKREFDVSKAIGEKQFNQNFAQGKEQEAYGKQNDAYSRAMNLVNSNLGLRQALVQQWGG